jgi:hypothetical protein
MKLLTHKPIFLQFLRFSSILAGNFFNPHSEA